MRFWQQDRHHGRRAVWSLVWLTQNPAGLCRQWMHSWMVCGRGRCAVMAGGRGFAGAGAGWFCPAATVAAAARF